MAQLTGRLYEVWFLPRFGYGMHARPENPMHKVGLVIFDPKHEPFKDFRNAAGDINAHPLTR